MASTVKATDFKSGASWLNVASPITLAQLKGRLVLLLFWRYSNANCFALIAPIERLQSELGPRLVVIGVHTPKYEHEKDLESLRQSVIRHEIDFPVVSDETFWMWRAYGVSAWPTFILIDGNGFVAQKSAGEPPWDSLRQNIEALLRDKGGPLPPPLPLALERGKQVLSLLSYPSGIFADEKSGRIYVSDTGHHRVLVVAQDGKIESVVGNGERGLRDGSAAEAQFSLPMGLVRHRDSVFVADLLNHAIRRIDLKTLRVSTVAGTGEAGRDNSGGGRGTMQPLNLPRDVVCLRDKLYVTMSGQQQIWEIDPESGLSRAIVGTALEDLTDGGIRFAALAGPAGVTSDGEKLFFADSESSAVRAASLGDLGRVDTLVGSGLFESGDRDGPLDNARLQHPLAIEMAEGRLFIADTYNHKIKELILHEARLHTLGGGAQTGFDDGPPDRSRFNEPSGLGHAGGKLYVADTNNHVVRVFDTVAEQWYTILLFFPDEGKRPAQALPPIVTLGAADKITQFKEVEFPTGREFPLSVQFDFTPGFELDQVSPSEVDIRIDESAPPVYTFALRSPKVSFAIEVPQANEQLSLLVEARVYYSIMDGRGVSKLKTFRYRQPIRLVPGSANKRGVLFRGTVGL